MTYRMTLPALAFVLTFVGRIAGACAGDAAGFPEPAEQPLAVIRLARPEAAETLLASRPARALGLSESDFSGAVPGLGGRVNSLRALLRNLDIAGAENLWLSLFTRGGTLFNLTALLGGERPVPNASDATAATDATDVSNAVDPAVWFGQAGWSGGRLVFREMDATSAAGTGKRRFALARDEASLREGLDGPGERNSGSGSSNIGGGSGGDSGKRGVNAGEWRADLRRFMEANSSGIGLWLNPRPLAGMVSLAAGIDLRIIARELGVAIPDSMEVEFLPDREDVGVAVRLNGLLPNAAAMPQVSRPRLLGAERKGALGEVRLASPAVLLRQLGWEGKNPLFVLNLKLAPLLPRSARLEFFRNAAGGVSWSLLCLMGNGVETRRQVRRARTLLDFLDGSLLGGVLVERGETSLGDGFWRLTHAGVACMAGFAERGGDLFFLAAAEERDYPDLARVIIGEEKEAGLLFWDVRPDAAAVDDAAALAAALLAGGGLARPDREMLRAALADDAGAARLEGRALAAHSRTGAGPLLLAALLRRAAEGMAAPGGWGNEAGERERGRALEQRQAPNQRPKQKANPQQGQGAKQPRDAKQQAEQEDNPLLTTGEGSLLSPTPL